MSASWLMGYNKSNEKNWKFKKDGARPKDMPTLDKEDIKYFRFEVSSLNAKSVLEFGPGDSTKVFAELGLQVTTVEHNDKWYEVAKERFKDYPNVRVLKGEDEMPFVVHGMGSYEQFDLAFVDAPQGYYPMRKIHKGYEDCSRFNTALFALERAPVVLIHDTVRPLERGTLTRLRLMGYNVELIRVPYGMARITGGDQNRFDTPRIEESGSPPPGPKSKRGRKPKPKRPDSGDVVGTGS